MPPADSDANAAVDREIAALTRFLSQVRDSADDANSDNDSGSRYYAASNPVSPEAMVCAHFLKQYPNTAYSHGHYWRCQAGLWSPLSSDTLRNEIMKVILTNRADRGRASIRLLNAAVQLIRFAVTVPSASWNQAAGHFPCLNGLLNLATRKTRPIHPPDFIATTVPYSFSPAATAPAWAAFLESTLPQSAGFLQEFAGLSLTAHSHHEVALWLLGPSGSGKSTFLHGLQALLGPRAGHLDLTALEFGHFDPAALAGQTLLLSAEQDVSSLTPFRWQRLAPRLNALISGEPVTVRRDSRSITLHAHAKLIWAITKLPAFYDPASGLFRRVHIVSFPALPAERRDPALKGRIAAEAPGILNWALDGLARLTARGHFVFPPAILEATQQFRHLNDIPAQFVADSCQVGPDLRSGASDLYEAYSRWCRDQQYPILSPNQLAAEWQRLGFTRRRIGGSSYWYGLTLPARAEAPAQLS